jgi:hypothetical protein
MHRHQARAVKRLEVLGRLWLPELEQRRDLANGPRRPFQQLDDPHAVGLGGCGTGPPRRNSCFDRTP